MKIQPDIKSETIKHYLRMREWVLTQNEKSITDNNLMLNEINESWQGDSCPYCTGMIIAYGNCCLNCPLEKSRAVLKSCCGYNWRKLSDSKTWKEWLTAWYQVVYYICVFG